jgi:hypothetical protein
MCINPYLWPARSTLGFENVTGREIFNSKDRRLDLADTLMLQYPKNERTVYFSLSTKSKSWPAWTPEMVARIEERIHYDFKFDNYKVDITRCEVPSENLPCTSPFRWKLVVMVDFDGRDDQDGIAP